jgi:hypothetical protein
MMLKEGGNVFKDADKRLLSGRINKQDVVSTLQWLEKITGLPHTDHMLGSTGRAETSGDLDVAVDPKNIDKDTLVAKLVAWAAKNHPGEKPRLWVAKTGNSVHFRTPINGNEQNGYVQTDLMFGDPDWMKFVYAGGATGSHFKGVHRAQLAASIAKAKGLKLSQRDGLVNRENNEILTKEPNKIAQLLLGKNATAGDMKDVESILAKIKGLPDYNKLVADARATFKRDGIELPEATQHGSPQWFSEMMQSLKADVNI